MWCSWGCVIGTIPRDMPAQDLGIWTANAFGIGKLSDAQIPAVLCEPVRCPFDSILCLNFNQCDALILA